MPQGQEALGSGSLAEEARLTFEVGCPYGGHSGRGGLGKAVEGCLLAGGLIRCPSLFLMSVIKHPHGLQGKLLSVTREPRPSLENGTSVSLFSSPHFPEWHTHLTPPPNTYPVTCSDPGVATAQHKPQHCSCLFNWDNYALGQNLA